MENYKELTSLMNNAFKSQLTQMQPDLKELKAKEITNMALSICRAYLINLKPEDIDVLIKENA